MKIIFYYFVDLIPGIKDYEINNVFTTAEVGAILNLSRQKLS